MASHGWPAGVSRRELLRGMAALPLVGLAGCSSFDAVKEKDVPYLQTVLGPVPVEDAGWVLPHEHVMVDFVGADKTSPSRWEADAVVSRMQPYVQAAKDAGISTFVDCTPAYLGRDVGVLQRLARLTDLHVLTNTGWYKEPYLPERAFRLSAEQIADEWTAEWRLGIDGTDVRPGFIKIAVHPGPLAPMQAKIVRAAALTSMATGLTVAAHTGHYQAAMESLDIAEGAGLDLGRYVVVHANSIAERSEQRELARRGAWLEYDGIAPGTIERHVELVIQAAEDGFSDQVLLSHDAGWYAVGEPNGGTVRGFTCLLDGLVPALSARGGGQDLVRQVCCANPARAFAVRRADATTMRSEA